MGHVSIDAILIKCSSSWSQQPQPSTFNHFIHQSPSISSSWYSIAGGDMLPSDVRRVLPLLSTSLHHDQQPELTSVTTIKTDRW